MRRRHEDSDSAHHARHPSRCGMTSPSLRPILGTAILRVDPIHGRSFAVASDLHLGLGAEASRPRGPPEADAAVMAEELCATTREQHIRRLVIAGDAKHPIVGTPRLLRPVVFDFFSTLLSEGLTVELVNGNHDVGIGPYLPREVSYASSRGVVRGGVGIFHGHCWPDASVLRCQTVAVGHLHPGVRLAPTAAEDRGKLRCWVRGRRRTKVSGDRRPRAVDRAAGIAEVIVLPAFNPLAGTEALNRERPARGRSFLFARFLANADLRAYLLDGTDLGALVTPRRSAPPKGEAAAP
jgi:uncharacterized protein